MEGSELLLARIMESVDKTESCWLWTGDVDSDGYGRNSLGPRASRERGAYRAVYVLMVGPVPSGLELDHLCRNRLCVRPDHLEPVTRAENQRRRSMARTHCKHGHELTEENVRIVRNRRVCVPCARVADRRCYYTKKVA